MMIVILVDLLIVGALLAADLISKYFAADRLGDGSSYVAIKKVLTFRYSENTGAAFGIFDNARIFLIVFVSLVIVGLIAFMVYHVAKKKHREKGGIFLHVSLSMIVAGGIGNLVDRIAFGYVRDFIDYTVVYTLFKKRFAICNLADVFLTIGVIMIAGYLIWLLIGETKKGKKTQVPSEETPANEAEKNAEENESASGISDEPAEEKPVQPSDEEAKRE